MKVLIMGAAGMLGHKLYQRLSPDCDVAGTIRGGYDDISGFGFYDKARIYPGVDARDISAVAEVVWQAGPDVVVNGIGVVKALQEKAGIALDIQLNALFPHQLYDICRAGGIRLIHISTDCVFSGRKGSYREDDPSDVEDIYGKTKYLGEVRGQGALTVRTSFIGRELKGANGLLEWFLSQRGGSVNGFTGAVFSGFPSLHLAGIIADIIAEHPAMSGLYHLSSQPITKFALLTMINEAMGLGTEIVERSDFSCDRSLDSTPYREETGFTPLPWRRMVAEMAGDAEQYTKWR